LRRAMLLAALASLVAVPLARADGDPASDYLLGQLAFVPPDAGVSSGDAAKLTSLLAATKAKGYTLHVALIATRYDMGSVTVLFERPHLYSRFLSQELRFYYKGRVLVVMPNGYSIARNGKADPVEDKLVGALPPPKPFQGAPLAAATARTIRLLARHAGVDVSSLPAVSSSGSGSSTTRDRILIGVGALVLLALTGGVTLMRRR
jgi:hypothetical protein